MSETVFLQKLDHFLNERVAPRAQAIEENAAIPRELLAELGELQAFGVCVPQDFGGLALPLTVFREMLFRIGAVSPSLGLLVAIPAVTALLVARYGNEEQRRHLLPALCQGKKFCAFAVTEAGGGWGDKAGTRAVSRGEGYLVSGEKSMISWGGEADYYFTTAGLEIDQDTTRPTVFLIHKTQSGISFGKPNDKMAFPAFVNCSITLDKVRCSAQELLGRAGLGLKITNDGFQIGRLAVASLALALASSCLSDALNTTTRVRSTGKRLADLQSIQFQLAEMKVSWEAGRALVNSAWDQFAENESQAVMPIAIAKVFTARMVMELADRTLQLHGGYGYLKPSLAELRFRQARIYGIIEGATEMQLVNIANRFIGGTA